MKSASTLRKQFDLTCIELCAGAGGQALGLEQANFRHLLLLDNDEHCCNTLRFNRPDWRVLQADMNEWIPDSAMFGKVDLLAAGLPCPPFSVAGKQLGENDERNLFPAALRIIESIKPKAVMIENVRGFLNPVFAGYREFLRTSFASLGYHLDWRLLYASDFGVPQLRPRVVLVALKENLRCEFEWPSASDTPPPTVGNLLRPMMAERGWRKADSWADAACDIAPTIVGGSKKHGGPDLGPTRARAAWMNLGVNGGTIAELPPEPNFAGMPRLTVPMVARIQGFPEDWKFTGNKTAAYRQVGNAFPPPVARSVAQAIATSLSETIVKRMAS